MCRRKKRNKGKEKNTSSASTVSGSATASGSATIPSSSAASGSTAVSSSAAASGSSSVHGANVELESNESFDLKNFINKDFFVEVFMSLVDKPVYDGTSTGKSKLRESVRNYRRLIAKHKNDYIRYADYTPPSLKYSQQIALYECTKIETAYLNNIRAHFGHKLRTFLNNLCGKKEKWDHLHKRLTEEGYSKDMIKEKIHKEVLKPCNQIKLAIAKKKMPETHTLDNTSKIKLQTLLSMYDPDYKFQKDSIYYDNKQPQKDKYATWSQVVNLKKKAFRNQGDKKSLRFEGTMESDGIGVSIIKQNTPTNRRGPSNKQSIIKDKYEARYIGNLTQDQLKQTVNKCVLIDPGRRDLIIADRNVPAISDSLIVTKALIALSEVESASINSEKFIEYIKKRASVEDILYEYHENETIKSEKNFFPDSTFGFRIDKKCNIIRGFYPQPEHYCIDSPLGYEVFISYLKVMLQQKHVLERLKKTEIRKLEELADMDTQTDNKDRINTILQKLQLLPFRKLKFSSKLFYDQNDQKLVKKLKDKFGPDPILVLGDWSAPNNKHQPFIRDNTKILALHLEDWKIMNEKFEADLKGKDDKFFAFL
ncbi:hypothetical protein MFLAVUS_004611 [Mucor flavus]|uniref:Uncharacterized protein n=1 Tax=Mucor flavus TaxID=439312 RepID=A0ABP9YWD0_9FUNG